MAHKRQIGVVSIMVTMIMMIVISLIVLGFAEISRTEQRNSTDNQLNTEAFYAAESGINDARLALISRLTSNPNVALPNKTQCLDDPGYPTLKSRTYTVNSLNNVSYTCLLITTNVPTLQYTAAYKPKVIPIISTIPFGTLTLDWGLSSGSNTPGSCPKVTQFPSATASSGNFWGCNFPLLRVDIADTSNTSIPLTRQNWPSSTQTVFFVPAIDPSLSGTIAWVAPRGSVIQTPCSQTDCTAQITGLNDRNYYLMVSTIYNSGSHLTLSSNSNFYNTQAIIDSTGKAQDTLRRVVVAIDLTNANSHPIPTGAIITENSICKQFSVTSNSFSNPISFPGATTGSGKGNPPNILCNP